MTVILRLFIFVSRRATETSNIKTTILLQGSQPRNYGVTMMGKAKNKFAPTLCKYLGQRFVSKGIPECTHALPTIIGKYFSYCIIKGCVALLKFPRTVRLYCTRIWQYWNTMSVKELHLDFFIWFNKGIKNWVCRSIKTS